MSFVIFLYIISLLVVRYVDKTWWSPGAILILLYTILVFFSPISQYTNVFGLLVLLTLIMVFNFGSLLITPMAKKQKKICIIYINYKVVRNIYYIYFTSVIFAVIGLFVLMNSLGIKISDFMSIKGLIHVSHQSAIARYQENFQTPLLANILFGFGYFAAFLSGFFVQEFKYRSIYIFIVFLLYTMIYSTKAAFLLPIIFFISSYLVRQLVNHKNIKVSTKYLLTLFLIIILIMVIASYLRYAGKLNSKEFFQHLIIYFIGNITPFTDWIANRYTDSNIFFGQYTFRSLFVLLHLTNARAGVYDTFVPILGYESSNIHTAFRGLIEDFTLIGTYFLLFILGMLSKLFYNNIKKGNLIYIALILPVYSFILWSPVYSVFAYNSLIFAHLLLLPLFWYIGKKRKKLCVK